MSGLNSKNSVKTFENCVWRKPFLKKPARSSQRKENEVKYRLISRQSTEFPVTVLCRVMGVSSSCFYAWRKRPAKIISADELQLYRRAKALFESSRNSLGSRTLSKKLCEEGFQVCRYRTRTTMRKLGLKVGNA